MPSCRRAATGHLLVAHRPSLVSRYRQGLLASLPSGDSATKDVVPPYERLTPTVETRWRLAPHALEGGFEAWPALDEIFPTYFQGVNHNRGIEGSVIDTSRKALTERMKSYIAASDFASAARQWPALAPRPGADGTPAIAGYDPKKVWSDLKALGFDAALVRKFLAFPLDPRFIYYETRTKLLNRARPEFAKNLADNEFLLTVPEPRKVSEAWPLYATGLVNLHVHERGSVVFPRETRSDDLLGDRDANIAEPAWRVLREHFGLAGERRDADARSFVARLFRVAVSVLHAPSYQDEHKSALSADWAHVPIPKDRGLFHRLVACGEQVTRLLDPGRDAQDVIEGILGAESARTLGPTSTL